MEGTIIRQLSMLSVLAICSYEDMKNKRISIKWLMIFAAEGSLLWIFYGEQSIFEMITAICPGLCVLLLAWITRGGIGEGDGLLLMVIGIFLGVADVLKIFLYGLFLSGAYAAALFVIGKKDRKYEIAFIPFLLLAFIGEVLLHN